MEKIGIIVEYNPFHNGHLYQLKKVKEMYPDSLIIVILNGYFMERGEISILTKEEKTKICLDYDVDIVVELPALYGTQSADTFAYQSIKILNELKIDKLVFGSETNNIERLKDIVIKQNTNSFDSKVKEELNKGISYPTALKNVLELNEELLPNDLLGISYIKAINKINPSIEPISILRTSNYHDINSNDEVISALNIRNKFKNNMDVSKYTPVSDKLIKVDYDLYFKLLKNKILTDKHLNEYIDVNEGIEHRLIKYINDVDNLSDYIKLVNTKRYSYNKINRMLLHIVLGLRKDENIDTLSIKILGFNSKGKEYLNTIELGKEDKQIKNIELRCSLIYDTLTNQNTYINELKNIPIIK